MKINVFKLLLHAVGIGTILATVALMPFLFVAMIGSYIYEPNLNILALEIGLSSFSAVYAGYLFANLLRKWLNSLKLKVDLGVENVES